MYRFHYNYVKRKWGDDAELLYMDTDSLTYNIATDDVYEDIRPDVLGMFDTSNFPENHPNGLPRVNKKVLGKFKDECNGEEMTEFCGLRAKLYSFTTQSGGEVKCKGIKKEVIKNSIIIENLKDVLFEGGQQMREMGVIRSKKHDLFSQRVNKVAISSNDDKRHVLEDGIHTLALGHRNTLEVVSP